jgi:hypothetical protein
MISVDFKRIMIMIGINQRFFGRNPVHSTWFLTKTSDSDSFYASHVTLKASPPASTFARITWELTEQADTELISISAGSGSKMMEQEGACRGAGAAPLQRHCHYAQRRLTSISPRIRACVKRIRDLPYLITVREYQDTISGLAFRQALVKWVTPDGASCSCCCRSAQRFLTSISD